MSNIYGKDYYDKFTSDEKKYDVLRPIRKTLRFNQLILDKNPSVVVFAFGNINYYKVWKRMFSEVWGYDINPEMVRLSNNDHLFEQDLTQEIKEIRYGDLLTCYYLFEHLTNEQVFNVIKNMMICSKFHIITLTPCTDDRYYEDPTHVNKKTIPEWRSFLDNIYSKFYYKRIFQQKNTFAYIDQYLLSKIKIAQNDYHYSMNIIWMHNRLRKKNDS